MDDLLSIHPDDWAKFQSNDYNLFLGFFEKRVELIKEMCDIEANYDVNRSPINECKNCSKYRYEHDNRKGKKYCKSKAPAKRKKYEKVKGRTYWSDEHNYSKKSNFPYRNIITRKPGKKEFNFNEKRRHDDLNFAVVVDGSEIRDTKFSDLWWPLLTSKDDELVTRLAVVIYRMGRMLDHNKDANGGWRLDLPKKLKNYFNDAGPIIVRDKKKKIEIEIADYLSLIDCLLLDEDLFYFRQTEHWKDIQDEIKITGNYSPFNTGRTYTNITGRISCSLGFIEMINVREKLLKTTSLESASEYLLDYSDRMMRGQGIARFAESTGRKNKAYSNDYVRVLGDFMSSKARKVY